MSLLKISKRSSMSVQAQVKRNTMTMMMMTTMTMIGGGIYSSEMEINRIILNNHDCSFRSKAAVFFCRFVLNL